MNTTPKKSKPNVATGKKAFIVKYLARQFGSVISDTVLILSTFTAQPFRDLARVRRKDISWQQSVRAVLIWPLKLLLSLVSMVARILLSPFEVVVGLFRGRVVDILWAIP